MFQFFQPFVVDFYDASSLIIACLYISMLESNTDVDA